MSELGVSWLNDFPDLKNDVIQFSNLEQNIKKSVWTWIKLIKCFPGFKTDAIQLYNLEQTFRRVSELCKPNGFSEIQ